MKMKKIKKIELEITEKDILEKFEIDEKNVVDVFFSTSFSKVIIQLKE